MSWTYVPRLAAINHRLLQIWGGAIPTAIGEGQVFIVPYASGSVSVTFTFTRAKFRLETPGTTIDTEVEISTSPGGGIPSWTIISTLTLPIADYEVEDTAVSAYTIDSGDLLRIEWMSIDPAAESPLIHLEGEA